MLDPIKICKSLISKKYAKKKNAKYILSLLFWYRKPDKKTVN